MFQIIFRPLSDDTIPLKKKSNFNWPGLGPDRAVRPPSRPAPALANLFFYYKNRNEHENETNVFFGFRFVVLNFVSSSNEMIEDSSH